MATKEDKLLTFFRREFELEEAHGFERLKRVPDSKVMGILDYYALCSQEERNAFLDCCAHLAYANYAFVSNAPRIDHTKHPYFNHFRAIGSRHRNDVPLLRAMVQQFKIDKSQGVLSTISSKEFAYASSICSIKAPELRSRVTDALRSLGLSKRDELGHYHCSLNGIDFRVLVDFGGRSAQLRYVVSRPEFKKTHPLSQFCFERALGVGHGDWNFIVEENVQNVFDLFPEVVKYSAELPERIMEATR